MHYCAEGRKTRAVSARILIVLNIITACILITSSLNMTVAYSSLSHLAQQDATSNQKAVLPNPYEVVKKGLAVNNYLGPLLELRSQEEAYLGSRRKGFYLEYMSYLNTYVGDPLAASAYEEKFLESLEPRIKQRQRFAGEISNSPIDRYHAYEALKVIGSIADKQQIIMINEEHRASLHRAFTLQLLPILYAKGYRYFAAETLVEADTELNRRGYPTQESGFYTADPVYADLVRTALKIGYKVVPYEYEKECTPKEDNPLACQDERERGQAQNLVERILRNDPGAKVLVHVGRDHNAEAKGEGFAMMAWHFKGLSQIDPFTIDQMHMSEKLNPADEEPIYRYVTRKMRLKEPTVFQSDKGEFWQAATSHDLVVFHPLTKYQEGRPTWLRMGGMRQASSINLRKLNIPSRQQKFNGKEPLLVQAFVRDEDAHAVPIDQIILYPEKKVPVLMLPKVPVRIRVINRAGSTIGQYETVIR